MTVKQFVFGVIIVLVLCSCSISQTDTVGTQLAECFQARFYNQNDQLSDPFPYYREFENVLIEKGYLAGTGKSDYERLWRAVPLDSGAFGIRDFAAKLEPNGFSSPVNVIGPKACLYELAEVQRVDDKEIIEMYAYVDRIYEKGDLGDRELNINLINSISSERWQQLEFRIPTLTFLYATIRASR